MKKFTLRGYLFSIIALFLCINITHAIPKQMFECTAPSFSSNINYIVQWGATGDKVYSTFGLAKNHSTDTNNVLSSLGTQTDDYTTYWTIQEKKGCCGNKTWEIKLVDRKSTIIDAKGLKCNSIGVNETLIAKVEKFYITDVLENYPLKYLDDENPIKLIDVDIHNIDIAEDYRCSTVEEGTPLVTKRRCCSSGICKVCTKGFCNLL